MRIETNRIMIDLLGPDVLHPDRISGPVPEAILNEIQNGFEELDGCIVAKGWFSQPIDKAGDNDTGVECLLNKIHVDSFVDNRMALEDVLRIGVSFALKLKEGLSESMLTGEFRIIIMGDRDSRTCTVRFHKLRPGQPWLDSDLEHYANPVMAIDFESRENAGR